jgi:hypothetical protein
MADEITLKIVLDHVQGMHASLAKRMDSMEGQMHGMKADMNLLKTGVRNIDERLDRIDITMVEQNHEGRIRKLEHRAELAKAA